MHWPWKSRAHQLVWGVVATLVCLVTGVQHAAAAEDNDVVEFFEREIRPILSGSCFECHGEKKQWAGLRLDSREAMLKGGDTGPAVVPGDAANSLLIQAVRRDGDIQMPPESELSAQQVAKLQRWVELGATWPKSSSGSNSIKDAAATHWAFQPLTDPPPPEGFSSAQPLDAFVLAKLRDADLSMSPPADRRTLIRRATFDLTGLPPTPEEVEQFVRDDDPLAYEKLIDRLLASPHYGEQWGRHWLDVARYSDTKGYVYAREERFWVHAWAYRDWVVKALNDDMPYDRFLLLQLAADQAAQDPSDMAAMGFLTIGRRFLGVTHDIIDDRVDVVTRGTMGLTVSCARCHDHKYDPIPTRDYYSLYGVFQSSHEKMVSLGAGDAAFEAELSKRRRAFADEMAAARTETAARVRSRIADYLFAQFELDKYPEEDFSQILTKDDLLPAFVRRWQTYLAEAKKNNDPIFIAWHAYGAAAEDFATHAAAVTQTLQQLPASELNPLVRQAFSTPPGSLREVADRYGKLFAEIEASWQKALEQSKNTGSPSPTELPLPAAEAVRRVMYGLDSPCEVPDLPIVHTEFYFDTGTCEKLWRLQGEIDRWVILADEPPPQAVVLVDADEPVTPRVFRRGDPKNKGDHVPRQFLELLCDEEREPFSSGSGRLELAEAIVSPDNPLTARVLVNRVWMHHFGNGLVRTPSDFGMRADPPSHPDLLDWLTTRFIEEGWSLKKLHRRIMLSQAYQQSSYGPEDEQVFAQATQLDPENRLLWRMNVRRLKFEEMHDALLSATASLDRSLGGKPQDLFSGTFDRRALYGLIDRQFFPSTLRIFDFASPDLHIAKRSDTTVPQRALYFLNDRFLLERAKRLAELAGAGDVSDSERVQRMYQACYQREASPEQLQAAVELVRAASEDAVTPVSATVADWRYGYGRYDEKTERIVGFTPLPHATEKSWQGGPQWPDAKLGWVQLTADGGHAGNDLDHAAIRRWVAPRDAVVSIRSILKHQATPGDGIRGMLVVSRYGVQRTVRLHNQQQNIDVAAFPVKAGDTIDFAVDIGGTLNNDQFVWEAEITAVAGDDTASASTWRSKDDFQTLAEYKLEPWEQLAQVLLAANEFVFVD